MSTEQAALDRLAHEPRLIDGKRARDLFAEHGITVHGQDPWDAEHAEMRPEKTTGTVHHDAAMPLHTTQDYLWRDTLAHFITHPEHQVADPPSTWQHGDQHWISGGHHRIMADRMTHRRGIAADDQTVRTAMQAPHQRIFGHTFGLDHRLFEDGVLKQDVREWILDTLNSFWQPLYGKTWYRWTRVYFAGSEASEWTSRTREGNGDFDVLIGIAFDRIPYRAKFFGEMSDDEIVSHLNSALTTLLWPRLRGIDIPVDGEKIGPFDATFFCNENAWNIQEIKPYAAYNVTTDQWAVKPPHLPGWSMKEFPEGHAMELECKAVAAYVRAILEMPEPYRSQQGDALWRHLHSDRGRSFTSQGEGWWDAGNVIEKYLDQLGLWELLAKIHFDALADPHKLDAPRDWSNDPQHAVA